MIRAFLALPLPEEAAEILWRRAGGAGVGRSVAADDLHLTLAFLGDQPEGALGDLAQELDLLRSPPVPLQFGPADFFGVDRSRVLAVTVAPDPALVALHDRIRSALRAAGITPPPGRFRPHVTVLRLPRQTDPAATARLQALIGRGIAADIPPVTARRLVLYRSQLDRAGARHDELATWPLGEVTGWGLDLDPDPGHDRDPGAPPARRMSRR